jgi:REP element-mobilizing transposase RayT
LALLAGRGWRSELLRRPRRFRVRADTKSRSSCEPRKSSPDRHCSSAKLNHGHPASVGRKSGAPSAAAKARTYFRCAGLSPQSGYGRNILYSEPARPRSDLLVTQIDILRDAVRRVRARTPFRIAAWVVLPDHTHCLRTLPRGDGDFPGRLRAIKTAFVKCSPTGESRSAVMTSRGERGIWQRRCWEDTIRDDRDYALTWATRISTR